MAILKESKGILHVIESLLIRVLNEDMKALFVLACLIAGSSALSAFIVFPFAMLLFTVFICP
jgi:hypothetical protein